MDLATTRLCAANSGSSHVNRQINEQALPKNTPTLPTSPLAQVGVIILFIFWKIYLKHMYADVFENYAHLNSTVFFS